MDNFFTSASAKGMRQNNSTHLSLCFFEIYGLKLVILVLLEDLPRISFIFACYNGDRLKMRLAFHESHMAKHVANTNM